jgi:hypothetical protein
MRKIIVVFTVIAALLAWQCTRNAGDTSLKSSVEESVVKINKAMADISVSKGFELMTIDDLTKSGDGYSDSIDLDLVAGIYDYKPDTFYCHHFMKPMWRFEKSGESDMMVVNIPQKLIFHPRFLHYANPPDSVAKNDFTISASEYHYYFSFMRKYDYRLKAGFNVADEDIGTLEVTASGMTFEDRNYTSEYHFTDDYSVLVSYEKGDTSTSSFALKEGEDILMAEETVFIWKDHHKSERKYTLTIGDVDIVRGTGIDSIQVYLDGVLQSAAAVKIHDDTEGDGEGSVCHHRDILITFDDGTTVKLSELIGPALETLKPLLLPMREMYFAKHIADHIALSIYYQRF